MLLELALLKTVFIKEDTYYAVYKYYGVNYYKLSDSY